MMKITFTQKSINQIKYILQQQFAKTYGKVIQYKNLLQRAQSLFKIMKEYGLDISNIQDLTSFAYALRDNLKNSKYQLIFENGTNLNNVKVKRTNKYEEVKNYATLINYIQNYPQGLLINDQFLKYTFKQIKSNIEKAVKQKRLKMIYQQGSKQQYFYLFPRIFQTQFDIRDNSFKYFTMNQYLDLCRDLNSKEDHQKKSHQKKINNMKEITGDLNYKLPGYMELKEKWINSQLKK